MVACVFATGLAHICRTAESRISRKSALRNGAVNREIMEICLKIFHFRKVVGMSARSTFRGPKSLKIAEMIYEAKTIHKQSILDVRIVPKLIRRRLLLFTVCNIFVFATHHNLTLESEIVTSRISLAVMDLRLWKNM